MMLPKLPFFAIACTGFLGTTLILAAPAEFDGNSAVGDDRMRITIPCPKDHPNCAVPAAWAARRDLIDANAADHSTIPLKRRNAPIHGPVPTEISDPPPPPAVKKRMRWGIICDNDGPDGEPDCTGQILPDLPPPPNDTVFSTLL
ncbi:hypothetical protein BC940DRAFT_317630 [Gongronella butleri]|nr:hypothetical protein BC940DRAFT_317630 [Gongronella butleri]